MSKAAYERIQSMLDGAQRNGRCLAPLDPADRKLCKRIARQCGLLHVGASLYARPDYWNGLSAPSRYRYLIDTLSHLHPEWVFCGPTAAFIWGLSLSHSDLQQVHIMGNSKSYSCAGGLVRVHAAKDVEVSTLEELSVCGPADTVVECLRAMDLRRGLALADSALRLKLLSKQGLIEAVEQRAERGVRGIRQARLTASLADPRAESGGESIARAVMYEHGFEMPDLQVEIDDPLEPGRKYRSDFFWMLADGSLVAGELDGRAKYADPSLTGTRSAIDVLADERLRESRIAASGVRAMRFSYRDAVTEKPLIRLMEAFGIPRNRRSSWEWQPPQPLQQRIISMPGWTLHASSALGNGHALTLAAS